MLPRAFSTSRPISIVSAMTTNVHVTLAQGERKMGAQMGPLDGIHIPIGSMYGIFTYIYRK